MKCYHRDVMFLPFGGSLRSLGSRRGIGLSRELRFAAPRAIV